MSREPLPDAYVLDTSVLSFVGRPSAPKHRRFDAFLAARDGVAYVPERVKRELRAGSTRTAILDPVESSSTERFVDHGYLNEDVRVNDGPRAGAVMEGVRRYIADETGQSVDQVAKTDGAVGAAGVHVLATAPYDAVGVLYKDRLAHRGLERELRGTFYEGRVRPFRAVPFFDEVVPVVE